MPQPNILLLITDQQRWDALSCVSDWLETPNMDRIAADRVWQPYVAQWEVSLVMRTATYGHKQYAQLPTPVAYRTRSVDGGRTWSVAEPEPSLHNTCSKGYYGMDAEDRELYVYSPGSQRERKALHYCLRPRGEEWSEPHVFYDGQNRNSYPVLVEKPDSPGAFWCVRDSSNDPDTKRSVIRFAEFSTVAG